MRHGSDHRGKDGSHIVGVNFPQCFLISSRSYLEGISYLWFLHIFLQGLSYHLLDLEDSLGYWSMVLSRRYEYRQEAAIELTFLFLQSQNNWNYWVQSTENLTKWRRLILYMISASNLTEFSISWSILYPLIRNLCPAGCWRIGAVSREASQGCLKAASVPSLQCRILELIGL